MYKDNSEKSHQDYIIGHLEKGYRRSVYVSIDNIFNDGILDINIK